MIVGRTTMTPHRGRRVIGQQRICWPSLHGIMSPIAGPMSRSPQFGKAMATQLGEVAGRKPVLPLASDPIASRRRSMSALTSARPW